MLKNTFSIPLCSHADLFQQIDSFMMNSFNKFTDYCEKSLRYFNYLPIHQEMRLVSTLFPSFHESGGYIFLEEFVTRDFNDGKVHNGRLDYWILYNDICLLIEAKSEYINTVHSERKEFKTVNSKWKEVNKQITSIQYDGNIMFTDKITKCSLLILTVWESVENLKTKPKTKYNDLISTTKLIVDKLTPKPNWAAAWYCGGKGASEYEGKFYHYSGVIWIARFE